MKLCDLLKGIKTLEIYGNKDMDITGIAYDSRRVDKGNLFVCITGLKTDGHKYIKGAIKNGAIAIIIEKDIDEIPEIMNEHDISFIKTDDTRYALSKLAANFYDDPSDKINVVGITGTNGKTSITYLISSILEANNKRTSIIGTMKNKIADEEYKTANTTPESLELQYLFSKMIKKNVDVCAMEVSSHSLDLKRVEHIKFNIGVFTNLTADHLDFHEDMENYKNAKIKLFYKTSDVNIINIDDKYGKEIYNRIKKLEIPALSYGIDNNCDIRAEDIRMNAAYSEFKLVTPKYSGNIKINIPGLFSIYNILAAIAVCYFMGYSYEDIARGVGKIKSIRGRFELVENDKGIGVIVDYAHTPDALENVLKTIKQFLKGRVITVFGCGGDRDTSKRAIMGKIAYSMSDYSIITNDNPRTENPAKIVEDILRGMGKDKNKYDVVMDRREAIKRAIRKAQRDDVVLIAGKGHETYQIINNEVVDFDDREVASNFLREDY
ncbi:UDP-N-acetylmuramoyl-L-alanyl-D-glutamate--2,6-diaminopimelate ligase [Paramaledivibacter caminithermalis]|jgi:UDP-N-acetylmuramoyl-L-alanyl-D-glutamate--2,6-diaminopimelate ligase|uniref:UDP-N-acetylmuramoyl-L-alanyl-D-glutamate--2,6-diaminopimelate ligase n=1 Tax=Paramaledivibacter caminithermalis (strain DSM 15212 / CIP 107654 / DViRD3) TaxID=1121301 RepID=A0A1M6S1X1_PARC5|nr:UDP-N-acetylmuramoyl-L-alanyl-D-glutamate--2,6-diaminopimelate ligase [Paramaledivibacter caminithermalis]SHK38666.1 UDP-N-acetylmuramoylalanyl-D-glutamate--2,6-diaminopimelate ligase [Paramaledivibacter caminithermalis DSM 15212]